MSARQDRWMPSRPAVCFAVMVTVGVTAGPMVVDGLANGYQPLDAVGPLDMVGLMLAAAAGLVLAWLQRFPVVVLGVVVVAVSVYFLLGYPNGPVQLCLLVAMFRVARLRGLRASLAACAAAAAVTVSAQVPGVVADADQPYLLIALLSSWLVVPWSLGALLQVRASAIRRAGEELVARAALEERTRIAAEVHDIAGHGFTAVAVQAGVALVVFDEAPEQAKESLAAIRATSTRALSELRTMLDAVDGRDLGDVSALVADVRAAGLPVLLDIGEANAPGDTGRVAYRVVREALTNILRHAGPTVAEVSLRASDGELVIDVTDQGPDPATNQMPVPGRDRTEPGAGRGLAGMRAQVSAIGGEMTAGPLGGGFRVRARLPLERTGP